MKIKSLFIILLAVGVSATLYFSKQTKVLADYSLRMDQDPLMSPEGRDFIYQALKSNINTGKIEPKDYIDMKKAVAKYKASKSNDKSIDYTWQEMGPDNFGGRTRAILPIGDDVVFAGSVAGGLWKSVNSGNSWTKVDADFRIVGSIGQADNGDIYVGTGSIFEGSINGVGSSGFMGEGLFRSTDGGDSFTLVEGTEPNYMSASDGWGYFNALSSDPNHPDRIWFAAKKGVGYVENGGAPVLVNNGLGSGSAGQDIAIANDGSVILVSVGSGRVKISTDGGETFVNGSDGTDLPITGGVRARVAISPSNSDFLYVAYANSNSHFGGLWQSTNKGESWSELVAGSVEFLDITGDQGYYGLALAVDPTNPDKVFIGGLTVWKAGTDIYAEQISTYLGIGFLHVHPDIHQIVFNDNNRMYIGCDGGVYGSADIGQTFFALNNGYNTQTFYNMAQSSALNGVLGGAQDNGTIYIPGDGTMSSDLSGLVAGGGDGFGCEISLVTEGLDIGFMTVYYGALTRAVVNGSVPASFYDSNILNQTGLGSASGNAGSFFTDIALFEDTEDEDSKQFIEISNPYLYDLYDADLTDDDPVQLTVQTNNKNIEFLYTLEDTLHYWAEIERPELVTTEPLTQDPNYWWLNPQPLSVKDTVYVDSITGFNIDTIIGEIVPVIYCDTNFIQDTIFFQDTIVETVIDTFIVNCIAIDFDTIMVVDTTFLYETIESYEYHYAADVVTDVREHKLISDPYTSLFAIGFNGSDGIWITREALNYNVSPSWMRVVDDAPGGGTNCLTFSHDGNRMYYSGWGSSSVYEVSNLDSLYKAGPNGYTGGDVDKLEYKILRSGAGAQITGIACDYFNPNHMVISLGRYGTASGGKIQETWNALSATPTWNNIWFPSSNSLAKMPCYDVIIDRTDETGATIVVGTEFGIFATENGGDDWNQEVNDPSATSVGGIDNTPVFELRQQVVASKRWWHPLNTGSVYAATHGRGIFRSDTNLSPEVGVSEIENSDSNNNLLIYPNPTSTVTTVEFELNTSQDVTLNIYSIQGELVKTIVKEKMSRGSQTIRFDVEDLPQGNYILHMNAGSSSKIGKFMILK